MKESNEHIQLKFNCHKDLDSMSQTDKGKFCSSCQKEVIDFTQLSYSEIQLAKGDRTEMCGMFLPEQIDPSLHPIELPKVRTWAFLSTILVSLNFSSVSAQSTVDPKIEQARGASNAPNLTQQEAKNRMENGQHISLSKAAAPEAENPQQESNTTNFKRMKKWFWSKRFPFIHRKRRHYAGRFI
ncbi:MAG: hypothetical protein COA38_12230 [Fluviicola sp.]|nr:MAG: hypothetical protein COA38_12230 [Fluviicola sp.]